MKKIITLLMVIAMIFSLSACGEPSGQHQDMVSTLDTVGDLQERQPTPTDLDFSLERYNLIRRAYWVNGQREKAAAVVCQAEKPLGYIVLFTESGSVVGRFVVDGKVSSLNSYLTPDSEEYSSSMRKALSIVGAVVVAALICVSLIFLGWGDTWLGNQVEYVDQKIDDATNYETRKTVEDSCRAMIASYEADKLTYEQYKDSENDEQRSWADQAKMRANRTAANYNNYILKNSYVWSGNIPEDILAELPIIE